MDGTQLDQLLERMPYSDGSGRRRLVTGGIVLVGIALIMYQANALPDFGGEKLDVTTVLGSPTLVLVVVLAIYATGSIVEMLGEYFLVRAASGAFRALSLPRRRAAAESSRASRAAFRILSLSLVPFLLLWHVIAGFLGKTRYSIDFASRLSSEAIDTLGRLPSKVIEGLQHPVGDDAEYAFRHITETLTGESDRKWARRLFNRVKDVSAVTTSLVLVGIFAWLTSALDTSPEKPILSPTDLEAFKVSAPAKTWERAVENFSTPNQQQVLGALVEPVAYEIAGNTYSEFRSGVIKYLDTLEGGFYDTDVEVPVDLESPGGDLNRARDLVNLKTNYPDRYYDDIQKQFRSELRTMISAGVDLIVHIDGEIGSKFDREFKKTIAETDKKNALVGAASLGFLLMYVGYFTGLRNAITSIIERIAIQVPQRDVPIQGMQRKNSPSNLLILDLFSAVAWSIIIMFAVISFDIFVIGYQESFPTWTMAVSFLAGTALSVWRWNRYRRVAV